MSETKILIKDIQSIMPNLLSSDVLDIPLRQRAKFEGWLKIELADALQAHGYVVRVEESYHGKNGRTYRADILATTEELTNFIMLKMVNTSFRLPDVERRTRPITKNISGVIADIKKLRYLPENTFGYVLFPIFPVAADDADREQQLRIHLNRIRETGVHFLVTDFVPRHSKWGLSWYLGQVI